MKKLILVLCSAVVSATLLTGTASADEERFQLVQNRHSIIGTWQVEVTVRFDAADCTASPPVPFGPNPFPSLNTFHKGGTVSETGSRSPPSMRSPGHGVWKRTGNDSFKTRYTFQGFDANGFLATNMDVRSNVKLSKNGQSFTGVSRLSFSDISGNVIPFCATLEGNRFTL